MSAIMQTAATSAPVAEWQATSSSEQLRMWVQSREGLSLWSALSLPITLEQICRALDQARANTCGLLLSREGTIIISAIHQETFKRLEVRYRAAAEAGLCFWWEGGTLTHIQECASFLVRVRSLPPLSNDV
jgi:hypothetical protein